MSGGGVTWYEDENEVEGETDGVGIEEDEIRKCETTEKRRCFRK
jgi:hypothetical protein